MPAKKRRSVCPVACTLDLIGDKWTLLVIRDLFAGKSHFHEFAGSPEKIATNILSDRLVRLRDAGLIDASPSKARAGSSAYTLTARGRSLFPVIDAMKGWGLANIRGTEARIAASPRG
ncbi:MAG: helix-turn-helix transcriptional regulator [Phycisphaeraceae bacterium]|nr:MAG: helix-turn-helix transcriptional regulator [Phycisphaeraceae bacterium]